MTTITNTTIIILTPYLCLLILATAPKQHLHSTFGSHDCNLTSWPCHIDITAQVLLVLVLLLLFCVCVWKKLGIVSGGGGGY